MRRDVTRSRYGWSAAAVALVACHAASAPPPVTPPPRAPPAVGDVPVAQREPVSAFQAIAHVPPVAAPPAGAIVALAVSTDGFAALTADQRGDLRLWPALDGTREPVTVDTPSATAIALAHHDQEFTAFFIDKSDALVIARLGADGATGSRAIVASPKTEAFAMAEPGLVVLRRDQTVAMYAPDGGSAWRIAALRGERITAITAAGSHAAAVVERDGHSGIRVLELAPHLAWGPLVARSPLGGKLAISPRGDRLAVVTREVGERQHLTVTDLRGGVVFDDAKLLPEAIGFIDDETLVATADRALHWIDLRAHTPRRIPLHAAATAALEVADGRAFTAMLGDVAIVGPSSVKFLGYALSSPRAVDQLPSGELLIASPSHLFTTDAQLELRRDLSGSGSHPVRELRWLGGDDVAVLTSEATGATGDSILYLLNVARGEWNRLRTELSGTESLAVQRSTGSVALSGNQIELLRYRAAAKTLVSVAKTPRRAGSRWDVMFAVPLDPALAGGARVAYWHDLYKSDSDPPTFPEEHSVSWFAADTLRGPALAKQAVNGLVGAIDAAGHVYAWIGAEHHPDAVTILAPGKPAREIPVGGAAPIWPDPRGERFAMTFDDRVVLFRIDGTRAWSLAIEHAESAIWLRDGTVAVINDSGIARLDPADGRVLAVRCGWQFGLADDPHETTFDPAKPLPSMCARRHP